jgi:RHS repeat-associated protein
VTVAVTVAVVTDGSLKHWNLTLPGGEVIGRRTSGSGKRYYLKDHQGSIRAVLDGGGGVRETRDYYPFGLPMPGRYEKGSPPTKEDYTGHVKDEATGLHYAGARYYSSAFGRWTTIDPLADAYPSLTPYNYVENNPTGMVDPSGLASRGASRLTSPVYNPDGELLGTDDEGLQGEPIIMEEDEFEQGMPHEEAKKKDKGRSALNGRKAEKDLGRAIIISTRGQTGMVI